MTTPPCGWCDYYAGLERAERTLRDITADALQANCGHCWAEPGQPCTGERPGMHLARYARARRRGLLTDYDMGAVLNVAAPDPDDVFTPATMLCEVAA